MFSPSLKLTVFTFWDFPGGSVVRNLPAMQETLEMRVQYPGQGDPLKNEMATHSNTFKEYA